MTITVTNLSDGDVLTYSLVVLRGTATDGTSSNVYVNTSDADVPHIECPVVKGEFVALYELRSGANAVRLAYSANELAGAASFTVVYAPPGEHRPFVRPVYLQTKDCDGSFQSPDEPRDAASGLRRLRTAALMLQCAMAELMHARGHGRRTFAVCEPVARRLEQLPTAVAHNTTDGMMLWRMAADQLAGESHRHNSIDLGVMAFSRVVGGKVKSHTALGGGRLALFGGATLWAWPEKVTDIVGCLTDASPFNRHRYFDDSAGRAHKHGRRMVTATTIGACLHELGHCFSLPHPVDGAPGDVMLRGFDQFDLIFLAGGTLRTPAPMPCWSAGAAARLRWHRFMHFEGEVEMRRMAQLSLKAKERDEAAADALPQEKEAAAEAVPQATPSPAPRPTVTQIPYGGPWFTRTEDDRVLCTSDAGIGQIAVYKNGDQGTTEIFDEDKLPSRFELPRDFDIRNKCGANSADKIVLSCIDADGRIRDMPLEQVKPPVQL